MHIRIVHLLMLLSASTIFIQLHAQEEEEYLLRETEQEFRHAIIASDTDIEVVSRHRESARQAMGVVSVINRREIELFGANNVYEIIDRVVGSYSLGTPLLTLNQISMRGDVNGNFSNRIAILLNGRPTWGSASEGVDYVLLLGLPVEIIERIEVHRGPGSIYHGSSAFIGAINIVTRRPWEENELTVTGLGGSHNAMGASFAGGVANVEGKQNPSFQDRISFYGGAKYYGEDGFSRQVYIPFADDGKSADYTLFNRNQGVFAEVLFKGLSINALYARSRISSYDSPLNSNWMDGEKYFINAGFYRKLSDGWNMSLNATFFRDTAKTDFITDENDVPIVDGDEFEIIDSEDWVFEGHLNGRILDNLEFTLGTEARRISGGNARYSYLKPYDTWFTRTYMDARYSLTGYLHFFAGLQIQDFDELDTTLLTPKVGAMVDILPSTSLKMMYGYATRKPSQLESRLIFAEENTADKAERIRTFEAQLTSRFEDVHFSATYFYSRYLDRIIPIADEESFLGWMNDLYDMTTLGFEIEWQYAALDNLYITGSYGYVENRQETFVPGLFAIGFSQAPTYFVKGGVSYFVPRHFSIGIFNSYYSKPREVAPLFEDPINPFPAEYDFMTINASYHFGDNFKISLYVTNALDEAVYWPDIANQLMNSIPGHKERSFYFTTTIRLGDFY
jgi:outer membrane receptor for ferrienterochelin and colicins